MQARSLPRAFVLYVQATSSFSFSFFDSSDLGMPEESPHPLEVWPIQEVLARMTLGVSFTFFAVRINATTEVTEDSIPCTTPPNLRCQSQLGGGLIHGEGNRIDSIPLPDWLANPRDKINGESIKVL